MNLQSQAAQPQDQPKSAQAMITARRAAFADQDEFDDDDDDDDESSGAWSEDS